MGTRADFYIGVGKDAQWIGSIAWDGYPDGVDEAVLAANDEGSFRSALASFFAPRRDVTVPEQGWPWPWDDSRTTDYVYCLDDGRVQIFCFGRPWTPDDHADDSLPKAEFPDMSAAKNVAWGSDRSGVIVVGA